MLQVIVFQKKKRLNPICIHVALSLSQYSYVWPLADQENKIYLICAPFGNFTGRDAGYSWEKFALLLPAQGQTWNRGLKGQKDRRPPLCLLYAGFFPGTWLTETIRNSLSEKQLKKPPMPCVAPKQWVAWKQGKALVQHYIHWIITLSFIFTESYRKKQPKVQLTCLPHHPPLKTCIITPFTVPPLMLQIRICPRALVTRKITLTLWNYIWFPFGFAMS